MSRSTTQSYSPALPRHPYRIERRLVASIAVRVRVEHRLHVRLEGTHVHNKATVAVANKLARIVWAVGTRQRPYQHLAPAA